MFEISRTGSKGMKLHLFVSAGATAFFFGQWQHSLEAGCFMMILLGFVWSLIDYFKGVD
jgi:hypothetical protein